MYPWGLLHCNHELISEPNQVLESLEGILPNPQVNQGWTHPSDTAAHHPSEPVPKGHPTPRSASHQTVWCIELQEPGPGMVARVNMYIYIYMGISLNRIQKRNCRGIEKLRAFFLEMRNRLGKANTKANWVLPGQNRNWYRIYLYSKYNQNHMHWWRMKLGHRLGTT